MSSIWRTSPKCRLPTTVYSVHSYQQVVSFICIAERVCYFQKLLDQLLDRDPLLWRAGRPRSTCLCSRSLLCTFRTCGSANYLTASPYIYCLPAHFFQRPSLFSVFSFGATWPCRQNMRADKTDPNAVLLHTLTFRIFIYLYTVNIVSNTDIVFACKQDLRSFVIKHSCQPPWLLKEMIKWELHSNWKWHNRSD